MRNQKKLSPEIIDFLRYECEPISKITLIIAPLISLIFLPSALHSECPENYQLDIGILTTLLAVWLQSIFFLVAIHFIKKQ